jgi:hypothetical protein
VNEKRIEQQIIEKIGQQWPPGRFLCATDNLCTRWQVLSFDQALQAISQHLKRTCFESQRIVMPNPRDVLVQRGNSQHQGNVYFRTLIEKCTPKAKTITHVKRKQIAKQIVDEIERVGGRFLKEKVMDNLRFWEPLDAETAMTKALQGMRDLQKKREIVVKPVKPVGVVVPTLNYVKENVENGDGSRDPPGVFYNYYSQNSNTNNNSLAISDSGKDPPGQVPNVILPQSAFTSASVQHQQELREKIVAKKPDSPVPDNDDNLINQSSNGNNGVSTSPSPPGLNQRVTSLRIVSDDPHEMKRKRSDMIETGPVKRTKLEP